MTATLLSLVLLLAAPGKAAKASATKAPDKADAALAFRLKPGAAGPACLQCHNQFKETLERKAVHTPVKSGQCTTCHNPHSGRHGKLLSGEPETICLTCHTKIVPAEPVSTHAPVAAGKCVACHDPHAAGFKDQLLKSPAETCAGCHQALVEVIGRATSKHKPVEQGCTTCHDPHASAKAPKLLKNAQPVLCLGCHDPKQGSFSKAHMGYPVERSAACTSCHDPHGSNGQHLLYESAHKPMATKKCAQCHEDPGSSTPLATRRAGADLCRTCHAPQFQALKEKALVHWPVLGGDGCINCHSPHAAKGPKLVPANLNTVCTNCHADTVGRQQRSPTKHQPMAEGNCTACHDPHASNTSMLFKESFKPEACGPCHEGMKHSSHPLGKPDPRNKNLSVSCLSCHRVHGTEFKHLLPYATQMELCTKCHEAYRR